MACAAMVVAMVVLGGLTRLTGSGLSMVEWQPLTVLPPLGEAAWQAQFAKYQASPEFRLVNRSMDLAGFQAIFWLEYVHRLWGRLIGLAFAVPLAVFVVRGRIDRRLAVRLALILVLGAAQGGVGWLMVASGLVERPSVSHYRLAAHLLLALLIFAALLWTGLDLLRPRAAGVDRRLMALAAVATATIAWGALVAGLDAGLASDTFPLMNGSLFPDGGLALTPVALNGVENPVTVQFIHRLLALTTLVAATVLWAVRRGALPAAVAAWCWVQAGLGVATVLLHVPVALAALHQAGAVVLVGMLVLIGHRTLPPRQQGTKGAERPLPDPRICAGR
ncbi:MAG: COX15/CtaA family protein [Magnetospirillum sp.]|nr:COX15/CtaA family protein [Magnetospirillum sp.]